MRGNCLTRLKFSLWLPLVYKAKRFFCSSLWLTNNDREKMKTQTKIQKLLFYFNWRFFFLSLWFFQNEQNRLQSLIQVWTILILEIAANIYLLCNNIAVYWCSVNCAQQQAHIWTKMQVRLFQAKFLLFLCRVLYLLQLDIFKKRAQIFQFFFPWKILSGNSNFDYQTLGKRQESGERK